MVKYIFVLENIMFKYKNKLESLKILDFGLVQIVEDYYDKTQCGTLLYMAPEQIAQQAYTKSVDIWAIGFILYILCSGGKHPILDRKMDKKEYMELMKAKNKWNFPEFFPLLPRNLFLKMCKFDSIKRYESYRILNHPWITRKENCPIPLSYMESRVKSTGIKDFKNVIKNILQLFLDFTNFCLSLCI
jgi:serine/threonine protein kinase